MNDLSEYLLETRNLSKQYGKFIAVNNVNLHIKKGAIYGFIGRNGAGKTTMLKMISGLAKPTCGEIIMFDKSVRESDINKSRVGCLIEAPGLYMNMSAYDNLKMKCTLKGLNDRKYIDELLEIVGLSDVKKKSVKQFSLGMKQRLGIALALVGEPDLLVLDEPINRLDPQGIAEIRNCLMYLKEERNMTVIISSHILEELSKIATDYGIIHHGVLVREITSEQLMESCCERIEIQLDDIDKALPVLDELGLHKYQVTDNNHLQVYEDLEMTALINAKLINAGICVSQIFVKNEELESYFLNITGGEKNV